MLMNLEKIFKDFLVKRVLPPTPSEGATLKQVAKQQGNDEDMEETAVDDVKGG